MNNQSFIRKLENMIVCDEAVEWVKQRGGTDQECWDDCGRGDWMDYYLYRLGNTEEKCQIRYAAENECPPSFSDAYNRATLGWHTEEDLAVLSEAADIFRRHFPKIPR